MLGGQRGDAGDESGPGECGESEGDGDDVADEEFGVFGVDAVGEDLEGDAEGDGDDEDFGPGGECLGAGGCRGAEAAEESAECAGGGVVDGLVVGEAEGGDGGDECADEADPGSGFEFDHAEEVLVVVLGEDDGDDRVGGGEEGADGEEPGGAVGAAGGEPAQALDAVSGEDEEEGECCADEGEDLESAGVSGDGEVAGEGVGVGPGEEGADEGECGAGGGGGAGCRGGQGEQGGVGGHRYHALSATRSPSRPCGRMRRTRMRSTKAHTSFQAPPPKSSMPGTSLM